MKTSSLVVLLALGSVLPATAVQSEGPEQVEPRIVVSYADLDLASASGAAVLHRRVAQAAEAVCTRDGVRDVKTRLAVKRCQNMARAEARAQASHAIAAAATTGTMFARSDR